ncbi:Ras-related protein Rab-21 [Hondaea fermentalgiana]|uniref:Ras-related protein Rab-21 n=1 Tax=Hondaea fermentalgiana TaxID=2315210 RepID=A0A2R5GJH1_9STRA|nr:Ras-related protein Rab-21 [Hondaea fermentalgiana]|eukprot:GBG30765.1 Ras-related protein Rab-21 [Hondaea fermentalgiana]
MSPPVPDFISIAHSTNSGVVVGVTATMATAMQDEARKVTLEDRAIVAEITKELFGGKDYVNSRLDDWVAEGTFYGVEACPGGPLVAVANVRKTSSGGYVEGVRSDPRYQRRGFGKKLLQSLISKVPAGDELMYQTFDANTASLALARRSGFEPAYSYRYASVTSDAFSSEPFLNAFPGKDVAGYCRLIEDACQRADAPALQTLTEETSGEKVVQALREIKPNQRVLAFQQFGYWDTDDFAPVFDAGNFVAQISPSMVSTGRIEANNNSLGNLATFTLQFGTTERAPTLSELWSHIAHWTRLAAANECTALCMHVVEPPAFFDEALNEIMEAQVEAQVEAPAEAQPKNGSEPAARGAPCVRKVAIADKTKVADIVRELFGENDYVHGEFDTWVSKGTFYGVEEYPGGPLVAFANVRKTSYGGYVEGVRADPRYQKRGFGAALLEHIVKNVDAKELRYQTFTSNIPSIRLALRCGFSEIARFRYSMISPPRFDSEPYMSGFPGLDVAGYLLRMEEIFGAVGTELSEERHPEAVLQALRDIRSERTFLFQHYHLYDPVAVPPLFEEQEYVAMVSPAMVSVGKVIESAKPLGRLLVFTLYFGTLFEPVRDEMWAHAAHWARLGVQQECEAINIHATPAPTNLEADVDELMGPKRELIHYSTLAPAKLVSYKRPVQLSIWDTAGQERFHALGPIYYRDADAALLVYDITDIESFAKVKTWVRELRKVVGDGIAIAIAGNKLDLARNRSVDEQEAAQYAAAVCAEHFQVSAKLNKGLEECFVELTRKMLAQSTSPVDESHVEGSLAPGSAPSRPDAAAAGRGKIVLVADDDEDNNGSDPTPSAASSCC